MSWSMGCYLLLNQISLLLLSNVEGGEKKRQGRGTGKGKGDGGEHSKGWTEWSIMYRLTD